MNLQKETYKNVAARFNINISVGRLSGILNDQGISRKELDGIHDRCENHIKMVINNDYSGVDYSFIKAACDHFNTTRTLVKTAKNDLLNINEIITKAIRDGKNINDICKEFNLDSRYLYSLSLVNGDFTRCRCRNRK